MSIYLFSRLASLRSIVLPLGLLCFAMASPAPARTITFAGIEWDVKSGNGLGPGPNNWSDSTDNVEVIDGKLYLRMTRGRNGVWQSAEVSSQQSFGHGEYRWKTNTNFEDLDKNVVIGLFTYENDNREIDVEFAKWGIENNRLGNFTNQGPGVPADFTQDYNINLNGDFSTHLFRWGPNQIDWASIHGHTDGPARPGFTIGEAQYRGPEIPPSNGSERVHMNIWGFQGRAPSDPDLTEVEIIISDFDYTPLGGAAVIPEPSCLGFMSLGTLALLRKRVRRG